MLIKFILISELFGSSLSTIKLQGGNSEIENQDAQISKERMDIAFNMLDKVVHDVGFTINSLGAGSFSGILVHTAAAQNMINLLFYFNTIFIVTYLVNENPLESSQEFVDLYSNYEKYLCNFGNITPDSFRGALGAYVFYFNSLTTSLYGQVIDFHLFYQTFQKFRLVRNTLRSAYLRELPNSSELLAKEKKAYVNVVEAIPKIIMNGMYSKEKFNEHLRTMKSVLEEPFRIFQLNSAMYQKFYYFTSKERFEFLAELFVYKGKRKISEEQ